MKISYKDNNLSNLTLAFYKLKEFLHSVEHPLSHLSVSFDLTKDSFELAGQLSQEKKEELSQEILYSVHYTFKEILDNYLMAYKRVFLNKLTIEADIDEIGIVYNSIKVKSRFGLNQRKFDISSHQILRRIEEQTEDSLINGFLEQAPTSIEFFLKRHAVRSATIVTDFQVDLNKEDDSMLSPSWWLALQGYIDRYCNVKEKYTPDCSITFSLLDHDALKVISGTVYPTSTLRLEKNKFDEDNIRQVLEQVYFIMEPFNNLQIEMLNIKRDKDDKYKVGFNFKSSTCTTNIDISSLSVFARWNELFAAALSNFLELKDNNDFQEYLTVEINNLTNQVNSVIDTHKLVLNYPQGAAQSDVINSIKKLQNHLATKYKVSSFILVKTSQGITKVEIIIEDNIDDISPNLAMNVNLNSKQVNTEMTYYCAITNNDIFVYQMNFKERVD